MLFAPLALAALIAERLIGYPKSLAARVRHPVMVQGAIIGWLETRLNRDSFPPLLRRFNGAVTLLIVVAITGAMAGLVAFVLRMAPFGWLAEALLASVFLAQKQLGQAVRAVARELSRSLAAGRAAIRHIAGRDPEALDEAGVARAAIESLAENASDGVIAPLFWLILFGLPGIAVYKAVNTADSMIGHRNARYIDFGRAAARLDDLVNWPAARLSALLFAGAAFFVPGANGRRAWQAARRDAPNHVSPNAGWPEAALAGALGFGLGGSRSYGGRHVDLAPMGQGRRHLDGRDIKRALTLYGVMLTLALAATGVLAALPF